MPTPSDIDTSQESTKRLQHDEALESLGIVVGEIAHDFNNILSLIFGYVEMALSEIPEGERARSDLEHVLATSDRAKELVARILTFSKKTKLTRERIFIHKPIHSAVDFISHRLPPHITLNTVIEEHRDRKILSNETEIYQIVSNLCANSVEALSESGGEIEVKLDYFSSDSEYARLHSGLACTDYAKITVSDTGCGMDIDTIENIYVPFFTTARSDGKNENRAGLGLTTVHNMVSSQGGAIFLESTPDKGTTFEICIPLVVDPALEGKSAEPADRPERTHVKHILFIDDDSSIIEMANKILEKNNYTVTSFIDGNEALAYFSQHPHEFDLVITDLIMPLITGTELASQISEINPNIPILLTTGFSEKITAATCKQWGISTVINKPFSIHDLLTTIESLS
ncbi:MAG: response regulator [Proteobacteria bacterium]|nr:response regulator [Pseudomonadota bacterium]